MKRSTLLFLLTALLLVINVSAAAVPDPTDSFYVADFASVIDTDDEALLVSLSSELRDRTGAQLVIVTLNGLGGENIERYCHSLFNEWGIGDGERNNGILLLMSIGDEDYWIMQGKGLEDSLSSGELGVLLDEYLEPYFAVGQYGEGALSLFAVLRDRIYDIYGGDGPISTGEIIRPAESSFPIGFVFFVIIVVWFIFRTVIKACVGISTFAGRSILNTSLRGINLGLGGSRYRTGNRGSFGGFMHNGGSFGGTRSSGSRGGGSFGGSRSGSSFGGSRGGGSHSGGGGSSRGGGAGRGRR